MIFLLKLLLISIVALITAILIVIKVRRSRRNNVYLLLALVPFIVAVLVIFWLTRMPLQMYLQDFKEVTGVEMPEDAQILHKSTSIPPTDEHASLMLVNVSREFYSTLPDHLLTNGLTEASITLPLWLTELIANYGELEVDRTFQLNRGKLDHRAYLLSDSVTVLIQRQKFKYDIHGK